MDLKKYYRSAYIDIAALAKKTRNFKRKLQNMDLEAFINLNVYFDMVKFRDKLWFFSYFDWPPLTLSHLFMLEPIEVNPFIGYPIILRYILTKYGENELIYESFLPRDRSMVIIEPTREVLDIFNFIDRYLTEYERVVFKNEEASFFFSNFTDFIEHFSPDRDKYCDFKNMIEKRKYE